MLVKCTTSILRAIEAQGCESYPHECCGFLLGITTPDGWQLTASKPADNQRQDAAHNRFLISPKDYLKAERDAEAHGLQLLGFYHSHPDHPAEPSDYDLAHAWPTMIYTITRINDGAAAETRAFKLLEDRSDFTELELVSA